MFLSSLYFNSVSVRTCSASTCEAKAYPHRLRRHEVTASRRDHLDAAESCKHKVAAKISAYTLWYPGLPRALTSPLTQADHPRPLTPAGTYVIKTKHWMHSMTLAVYLRNRGNKHASVKMSPTSKRRSLKYFV